VFSEDKAAVQFSSAHRSKGLEAENVYILEPGLMPHPMAKLEWEKEQEGNVWWVAHTRSKKTLTFVVA
jgi:superfamily I DNA/RNA helicase